MAAKETTVITIQPEENGSVLPYPYHIHEGGQVGRQDFWQGRPKALLGFTVSPSIFQSVLDVDEFFADPQKAVGLYPIFANAAAGMYTLELKVGKITRTRTIVDGD